MSRYDEPGPRDYPYFEAQVWGGRLQTPPEYRGTPLAKQFESGRIGGRKITKQRRFADSSEGRERLVELVRREDEVEVYYVRSHTRPRQRIGTSQLYRAGFISNGLS